MPIKYDSIILILFPANQHFLHRQRVNDNLLHTPQCWKCSFTVCFSLKYLTSCISGTTGHGYHISRPINHRHCEVDLPSLLSYFRPFEAIFFLFVLNCFEQMGNYRMLETFRKSHFKMKNGDVIGEYLSFCLLGA